jgi:hypothetical protein
MPTDSQASHQLTISRARRGVVPPHNLSHPSSRMIYLVNMRRHPLEARMGYMTCLEETIRAIAIPLFGSYRLHSRLDVVKRHSRVWASMSGLLHVQGDYSQTVMRPATAPVPNVIVEPSFPEAGFV